MMGFFTGTSVDVVRGVVMGVACMREGTLCSSNMWLSGGRPAQALRERGAGVERGEGQRKEDRLVCP